MRKILFLLYCVVFCVALTGCGPKIVTKQAAFPLMYEERPLTILAVPPLNESTSAEAIDYYATTIAEPLSFDGYYILPIEVTSAILAAEGLYDAEIIREVPPAKFKEFFGADAVLYTKIREWDTAYYVIGGHVTVGIEFLLVSTTSGEELWHYDGRVTVDTSGDTGGGGGVAGLLIKVATAAIETATTDYVPIAGRVNRIALYTIPYGSYHAQYGQDGKWAVVNEEKSKGKF